MSSIFPLIFSFFILFSCGKHEQTSSGKQGVQDIQRVTNPDALSQDIIDENVKNIRSYLMKGGRPEDELKNGRTLLTEACFWLKIKVVELLVEHDADIKFKDRSGKSGLDYGEEDIKIKRALLPELVIVLKKTLFQQVKDNDLTGLKKTLNENPPLNFLLLERELGSVVTGFEGETLLTFCIKNNLFNVLRLFAQPKLGLDVNQRNSHGESPLQTARNLNNKNIEKLLLKLGAIE
ncbi:MAG: hypothetical protein ACLGHN_16090 [Bacteriovoracia bacterium]